MSRRLPLPLAAAASGALLLAGCAAGPIAATPAVQRAEGTVLFAAGAPEDGAMQAGIAGALTRLDGGCLALDLEGELYPLRFPFGSRLSDDGEAVEVPGYRTIAVGELIEGGGGGYVEQPDAPEECRVRAEFAVWQTVPGGAPD